nr:hypothetical protein CFP56_13309 [Quercus suber]
MHPIPVSSALQVRCPRPFRSSTRSQLDVPERLLPCRIMIRRQHRRPQTTFISRSASSSASSGSYLCCTGRFSPAGSPLCRALLATFHIGSRV